MAAAHQGRRERGEDILNSDDLTHRKLRILAISAFHPPDHAGGYELRVKEILDGLAQRGHAVQLLTNLPESAGFREGTPGPYPVIRLLHNRFKSRSFPVELLHDLADTRLLEQQMRSFQPDVVYLGHIYILSKALLPFLAHQPLPIYFDEGGSGLIDAWQDHGRWFRLCGEWRSSFFLLNWLRPLVAWNVKFLSRGRLQREWRWPSRLQVVFNSRLNLDNALEKGVPLQRPVMLHSGIDLEKFWYKERQGFGSPLRILVPGRLERRKGQADALELLRALMAAGIDARLILAGADWSDGYAQEVKQIITAHHLHESVSVKPLLPLAQLVEEYSRADICFFPSYFRTGFSRTPLEAMACGCLVLTYGNEGSDEIIRSGENGFIVKPGDIEGCVKIISQLSKSPAQYKQIMDSARKLVETGYSLPVYLERIEATLVDISKDGAGE